MQKARYHKSASLLLEPDLALRKLKQKITIDPLTGCHNWQGSTGYEGYGQVGIEGRTWATHRLMFELAKGSIPPRNECLDGKYFVLHKCDNPKCCNPDHLYLGSAADNSKDMADRCRCKHGNRVSYLRSHRKPTFYAGTVFWEYRGEIKSLKEWSDSSGIDICTLDRRFNCGWPEDEIFSPPTLGLRRRQNSVSYRRFSGVEAAEAAARPNSEIIRALSDRIAKPTTGESLQAKAPAAGHHETALQGDPITHGL